MNTNTYTCPHCGRALSSWDPGPEAGWDHDIMVCNNNDCAYFKKGREKIADECQVNFGYRYCFDPEKGRGIPIITWCGGDLSIRKRGEA